MLDGQSIASLDAFVGALAARRVHILSGLTGTGKTAISLRFIDAGLRRGERALLLTSLRPSDLRSLATHLGLELEAAIAEDRLVILRHGRELTARLGRPGALHSAVDELRALAESVAPARVVIDSVAPFLADDGASAGVISRLARLLETLEATTIVTIPGRFGDSYDRRLDALVQDAAGIFHLSGDPQGAVAIEAVTVRTSTFAPLPARIMLGRPAMPAASLPVSAEPNARGIGRGAQAGVTEDEPARPTTHLAVLPRATHVALVHESAVPDAELVALLRGAGYDIRAVRGYRAGSAPLPALAIIVETTWQTLDAVVETIAALGSTAGDAPIVAISPFDLRSADRARGLRAGADEFLTRRMGPGELLERLALAVRRRRMVGEAIESLKGPKLSPTAVRLTPRNGDVRDLAELAAKAIRCRSGDRATVVDGSVMVHLEGIRRRDAVFFTDRVKTLWARRGHGTLHVDAREHGRPAGDAAARDARAQAEA